MACCLTAPSHYLKPMLTYHQWGLLTFSWGQFHKRYLSHHWLKLAWKLYLPQIKLKSPGANELTHCDAIWHHRICSALVHLLACCLMAPSHYLYQCWLIINEVLWYSPEGNITRNTVMWGWNDMSLKISLKFTQGPMSQKPENYQFKIASTLPRVYWILF